MKNLGRERRTDSIIMRPSLPDEGGKVAQKRGTGYRFDSESEAKASRKR